MYDVRISDSLYQQASQAAQAHHVSVEEFIAKAVLLYLQDEDSAADAFFTPARIAEIREAQAEARTGNNLTPDQVEAHFAAKQRAWLANHPG